MTRFERWSIWITTAVTALSGTLFFLFEHLFEPTDPWAMVNHPLQPIVLKVHILAAPLMLFAVGLVMSKHIWKHLKSGTLLGRRSGLLALLLFAPLVLTGYVLQILTDEGWLASLALAHFILGVIYVLGLAVHRPLKQLRRERSPAAQEPQRRVDAPSEAGLAWNRHTHAARSTERR